MSFAVTKPRASLGDLTCWGVDVEAWERDNRIPLFADRENIWIFALGGASYSDEDAKNEARTYIEDNFFSVARWGYGRGRFEIKSVEVVPNQDVAVQQFGQPVATIAQTKNPTLTMESGFPIKLVLVKGIYRGSLDSVPWLHWNFWRIGKYCPKNARGAVWAVFKPGEKVAEDPCSARDAWLSNPECKPWAPQNIPWWVWVGGGGLVLLYTWPIAGPALKSLGKRLGEAAAPEARRRSKKRGK